MAGVLCPSPMRAWKQGCAIIAAMSSNRVTCVSSLPPPMGRKGARAQHIKVHGEGVKDVAFRVDDAEQAYREATSRGAQSVMEPMVRKDDYGMVKLASIGTYGDTIHT